MFKTLLTVGFLVPTLTLAATPAAFMENSQVVATGQKIQAFRVPTRDVNGAIRYYDISINLNVKTNGTINPIATGIPTATASSIVATASPSVQGTRFIPGTYKDPSGAFSCLVNVTNLIGGRSQASISCKDVAGYIISGSVVTGVIAGHPFSPDLTLAKINTIAGYQNFAWGKVGNANGTLFGCMNTGNIISATQVGNSINLSCYNNGNIQKCGTTLTKQ
jgi:hypothetical protein